MLFSSSGDPTKRPTRIMVVGSNGQFGTDLTEALVQRHGKDAIVTADLSVEGRIRGVHHEWLDVMDRPSLNSALERHNITQIYHLAAASCRRGEEHLSWVLQLNINGLVNVLDCAARRQVERVFWPSSHTVFGPTTPQAQAPQHAVTEPSSIQGITKLAGEGFCDWFRRERGVDVRCLRLPGLLSWQTPSNGEATDFACAMFAAVRHRLHFRCPLHEDTLLPFLYMPDAIAATLALMDEPSDSAAAWRPAYNVMSFAATPAQLARELGKYVPNFSVSYEPDPVLQAVADTLPHSMDLTTTWKDLAWAPRFNLEFAVVHMLRQYPEWMVEELPDPMPNTPQQSASHVPEAGHTAS